MATRQDALVALVVPVVDAMGCRFWGLEYLSSGRSAMLRIYIENDPITVEDCEKVSRQVASLLDVEDLITSEYTLEVSSPGLDRSLYTLVQYEQYKGEKIVLKLRLPYEGRRNFKGRLNGIEGENVLLAADGCEFIFPINSIERANIVHSL